MTDTRTTVRVLDQPLVWVLVRETPGVTGRVSTVELAAAGRRLVVPRAWVYRVDDEPTLPPVVV